MTIPFVRCSPSRNNSEWPHCVTIHRMWQLGCLPIWSTPIWSTPFLHVSGDQSGMGMFSEQISMTYFLFSGFSVGSCINEEKLSVTNLSSENNLLTFRLNAPVVIRVKLKEVRTNIAIYSHTLLRIHVIGCQRSVRIAPPSLPLHHSGPATRDFQSSISVEALF